MDTSDPKPRVNFNYLQQYVDKRVLLVGVVEKAAGGNVQIRTSDGGNVTVQTQGAPAYTSSDCVEFDAKVVGPNCVQELGYTRLSSGFDLENYDKLVQLTHTHGRAILLP